MTAETSRLPTAWATSVALVATVTLAGACGVETPSDGPGAVRGGDEPTIPQALAWLAAEHVGEPSSATVATDFEELGRGTVGTELRFRAGGEHDGDLLAVAVATDIPPQWLACDSERNDGVTGCERTADGLLMWQGEAPEEDPGNIVVVVDKGDAQVLVVQAGPAISDDPRELELPISVDAMFDLAADPRVDLTTSAEATEAARSLPYWRG